MDANEAKRRILRALDRHERATRHSTQAVEVVRRKPRAPRTLSCGCPDESVEQKAFISDSRKMGVYWHWTRAERKEGVKLRAWARAMGEQAGMPDLVCISHPSLALEMKAQCKRHTLSDTQRKMKAYLESRGWTVLVAHGAHEALRLVQQFVNGQRQ